ncbi:MAG: hypothetical protein KDB27_06315 [Planctomycetales bacterium]|nr:hypothetical protein [Planctomycetales bacterium]
MRNTFRVVRSVAAITLLACSHCFADNASTDYGEILVIDEDTGRGVPLVELTTVNHLHFVSDSAGRIAIREPGLMERPVFFYVRSHGYEFPKDGFGYRGSKVTLAPGKPVTLRLKRMNIAERLYRITGEGIYRDSVLLDHPTPLKDSLSAGKVVGQDSAFAVPHRDKLFWFWGDTSRISYPLGHFWMAGATSEVPGRDGLDPAEGVDLNYFVDETGFSRPMCRLGVKRGLIWADAFATVRDDSNQQRLVCHYAHMESLSKILGHGLAIYDDEHEEFRRLAEFDLEELWRWSAQSHPIHQSVDGTDYLLLGDVYPTVRVPARLADFKTLDSYESWTCLLPESTNEHPKVDRNENGQLRWQWRADTLPVDHAMERKLIAAELITRDEARGQPVDAESGKRVRLHRGSVNWNAHRKRWIMIACEQGGTSNLGEIWYAEADEPTGPWRKAQKIVSHDKYSFYNPVHHAFFDQGRYIYFEGTYTTTFSGNQIATPRYDYNQIMYRLDLDDARLESCRN